MEPALLEFVYEYGLFLAKAATLVAALLILIGAVVGAARQLRGGDAGDRLEVTHLNERLREMAEALESTLLDEAERKQRDKQRKREEKAAAKARSKGQAPVRDRVFVIDFDGDLRASAVAELREEITAILQVGGKEDEVVLRLESEGGLVHGYGLAASQLARLRDSGLRLTVAVDKVAASGGYLMACVAHKIIAAPFAILGSIGVVGQLPNFNRLMKKHDIDYEMHTAGEFKRTLTVLGENTDSSREKFREELEETHTLFKRYVAEYRPSLPIDKVATGEHWFGRRAQELRLVDEIKTSDDYLLARSREAELYAVHYKPHRSLPQRLAHEWMAFRAQRRRDSVTSRVRA